MSNRLERAGTLVLLLLLGVEVVGVAAIGYWVGYALWALWKQC